MAVQVNHSDRSFNSLVCAQEAFSSGNRQTGFQHFQSAAIPLQHKVYERIWIDRNRPTGNLEYGRQAFNDTHGLSSSMQEKAQAIDPLVKEFVESNLRDRRAVYKNTYNYSTGNYDRQFSHYENIPNVDNLWLPTTAEECTQVSIVLVAVGSVGTCIYSMFRIFSAFKH